MAAATLSASENSTNPTDKIHLVRWVMLGVALATIAYGWSIRKKDSRALLTSGVRGAAIAGLTWFPGLVSWIPPGREYLVIWVFLLVLIGGYALAYWRRARKGRAAPP